MLVLMIEWRNPNYHFVYKYTEGPPVEGVIMAWAHDHLWWDVFGRTTKWVWLRTIVNLVDLGKAKVGKKDVPIET